MLRRLHCSQGHTWEAGSDTPPGCPVCGEEGWPIAAQVETITCAEGVASAGREDRTAQPTEQEEAARARLPVLDSLPGFEVLDVLGRGGMGVVYRARQARLNRIVAVKMILAASHASAADLARFRAEAEVIAQLRHPHIVQIYSVGDRGGRPFFVLEYVAGGNLAQKLQGRPQPPLEAARLIEMLARGIQAAHQHGIIHRDLKPANVLLSEDGTPKIADFGLAKRLDAVHGKTQTGAILGTPAYMAPEQAAGKKDVGPAADVYALGAILYELLTGRPPFQAESPLDTVLEVVSTEVTPPRRLQPQVPRDLETICLKCLHKEPQRRYATALDLAEDLHRFGAGRPIQARPASVRERAWKWLRRRPAVTAGLGVMLLALVCAGFRYGGDVYRMVSNQGQVRLSGEPAQVVIHQDRRNVVVLYPGQRYTLPAGTYQVELAHDPEGLELSSDQVAIARNGQAVVEVRREEVGEVRHFSGHKGPVCALALTPDGRQALSISGWMQGDRTVRVWDVDTGEEVRQLSVGKSVVSAAFSPDCRHVLVGLRDGTLHLSDTETGQEVLQIPAHPGPVQSVAVSADGKQALSGGADGMVRLWDLQTGRKRLELPGHTADVLGLAFRPDGKQAASAGADRRVRLWDLTTGKEQTFFQARHTATVLAVAFSPDGRLLASGGEDHPVRLWDVRTGALLRQLQGHSKAVTALAFQAGGGQLVSGSFDRTLRVWDVASGKERFRGTGHGDGILAVAIGPGRAVLTAGGVSFTDSMVKGRDFNLRWWQVPRGRPAANIEGKEEPPGQVLIINTSVQGPHVIAFSPDGASLLDGSVNASLRRYDADNGTIKWSSRTSPPGPVLAVAFSADGQDAWSAGTLTLSKRPGARIEGEAEWFVWPVVNLRDSNLPTPISAAAFWPEGGQALLVSNRGSVCHYDFATKRKLREESSFDGATVVSVDFSPDGTRGLLACNDHTLWLWQLKSGEKVRICPPLSGAIPKVLFSPDGKRGLSAGGDGTVRLWDLEHRKEQLRLVGHKGAVGGIAFAPNGSMAASGGEDRTIRLWDLETGQEIGGIPTPTAMTSLSFAPWGDRLAAAGTDPAIWIWKLPSPSLTRPTVQGPTDPGGAVGR